MPDQPNTAEYEPLPTEQFRDLVAWLASDENDGGWHEPAARQAAHAFRWWMRERGYVVIPDEPNHYVTFDQGGWFIEHSVACRVAGTIGTCEYNAAIRVIADGFDPEDDPDQLGRWRITDIDSEGLPSLERAHTDGYPAG